MNNDGIGLGARRRARGGRQMRLGPGLALALAFASPFGLLNAFAQRGARSEAQVAAPPILSDESSAARLRVVVETPAVAAPKGDAPKVAAPKVAAPKVAAPGVQPPIVSSPVAMESVWTALLRGHWPPRAHSLVPMPVPSDPPSRDEAGATDATPNEAPRLSQSAPRASGATRSERRLARPSAPATEPHGALASAAEEEQQLPKATAPKWRIQFNAAPQAPSDDSKETGVDAQSEPSSRVPDHQDREPPLAEVAIEIFRLKHADANAALRIVEHLVQGDHTPLAAEVRTNSLIVKGDRALLGQVKELLTLLDVPSVNRETRVKSDADAGGGEAAPNQPKWVAPTAEEKRPDVVSLRVGFDRGADNADSLRRKFQALERQCSELADRLRKPAVESSVATRLKAELRDAVRRAFEARQAVQRAELAEFAARLEKIQQSIEMRERVGDQIVDRRVEELLEPNLQWTPVAPRPTPLAPRFTPLGARTPARTPVPAPAPVTMFAPARIGAAPAVESAGSASLSEYEIPLRYAIPARQVPDETLIWRLIGAKFIAASDELAGTGHPAGLKITELLPGGPAATAGLRRHDIIVGIGDWQITRIGSVNDAWQATRGRESVKVILVRGRKSLFAQLKWKPIFQAVAP